VAQLAPTDLPILVAGQIGSGKEPAANTVLPSRWRARSQFPIIASAPWCATTSGSVGGV
jgi:DNA-binding NtrC family response regulator